MSALKFSTDEPALPVRPIANDERGRRPARVRTVVGAYLGRDLSRAGKPRTTTVPSKEHTMSDNAETAILAGGCFWGVQDLLRQRDGVISTRVGYTGGKNEPPTYRNHPGHAEAVEIVFDPERISYRDILEFFFQIHDPTTKDRQGNDIGSSYRSEIFYTSDEQRQVAEDTIADVDASGLWPGKVVTEISEAVPFWEAEPEHQDYLQRYPSGYTCHFPRPGWKLPHRATAA
jgi:peptide-methionine (S)-S-oxide reductase